MNFLKKPWVIGGLIGILAAILITIVGGILDMMLSHKSFIETFGPLPIFGLLLVFSLGSLGILFGFFVSSRRKRTVPPAQNLVRKAAFIGGFIGFALDLFIILSGSPDPEGALFSGLILFPILVGMGTLAGIAIGAVIGKIGKLKSE